MLDLKFAVVKGWSMAPILEEGDLVAYKRDQYSNGDILIFNYNDIVVTHRLIYENFKLVTKGDNYPYVDQEIERKDVIGVIQFVIKKNKAVFLLNHKLINKYYLNYALLEIKVIKITKALYHYQNNSINFLIKNILFPWYACNYLLQVIYCKQK